MSARGRSGVGRRRLQPAAGIRSGAQVLVVALVALFVSGCASVVPNGPAVPLQLPEPADSVPRDGPPSNPPPDLARVPDAEPRVEPIRDGGPNKPYVALGERYTPLTQDLPLRQRGLASWYGRKFHGKRTASGEPYDMYAMTAAHPTLPIPSYVRVRNPATGGEVVLRVNDRGPFHSDRIVDVSYTAALKLGLLRAVGIVELERITFDDIRTGAWRRTPADPAGTRLAGASAPAVGAVAGDGQAAVPPPTAVAIAVADPADASVMSTESAPLPAAALSPSPAAAPTAVPAGFWVQIGAFQQRSGAELFHRRVAADVDWLAPLLAVFAEPPFYRLQAGPYQSRSAAQGVAQRVREALQLAPIVLERR